MTAADRQAEWRELWAIFHEALEIGEAERARFLDGACADNPERRDKLEKMLVAHGSVDDGQLPSLEALLDDAAGSDHPQRLAPGDLQGPYRIDELIGEGGMGIVYRAHQIEPVRRTVALKVLQQGMVSRDVVSRFNAERQALAMMSHSNIAKVFDAGTTDRGQPYFAMEFVAGQAVTEYCDSKKLSINARLRLFVQICDGVQHAHQKGITHRDIKPSNILVTQENDVAVPKVIDFGIAKATDQQLSDETLSTRAGMLIGTPGYMSPEQAGVVALDVDSRADVYSLGVLLYELLVGVQPFELTTTAKGLFEIQKAIRDEEPKRPSRRLLTIPEETCEQISRNRSIRRSALQRSLESDIEWILFKAMDKDRERRYQSVAELAADIVRYIDGMPVSARAPTRRYLASKFVRRHAVGVSMAAIVSVLILVFAGTMAVQTLRLQRALQQATLERNRAEAVSDFMVELFEAANPEVSGVKDVTARQILDQGAARLNDELIDQPELRAGLLRTIGETYRVLGGVENAGTSIELFEKARDDLLSVRPTPSGQMAAVLNGLGSVYHDSGNYDEAELKYRSALAALADDEDAKLKSDVLANLSVLYTDRGDLAEAEKFARESLAMQTGIMGSRDPTVARLKQRLAYIVYQRGKMDEALELINDTVSVLRERYGAASPMVATALNYAAIIERGSGDPRAAQRSLLEAADIYRTTHGPDHPYLANTMSNLAIAYNQTGDFAKAADALAEALRVGIASYGPDHPNVNSFRINLATNLQDMGRLAEAEPLLRDGLRSDREQLDPGSPHLLATLDRYGALLDDLGKHSEAEALLQEAVNLRRQYLGNHDTQTAVAVLNLARNQVAQGKLDSAEQLANDALRTVEAAAETGDTLARSLAGLGHVRYAQGRPDEAIALLQKAVDLFGAVNEKTVLPVARAWLRLAELNKQSGDLAATRSAFDSADQALSGQVPDTHPEMLWLRMQRHHLNCESAAASNEADAIRALRPALEAALGAGNSQLAEVDRAAEKCSALRPESAG